MENNRFLLHLLLGTAATLLLFLASAQVPLLGLVVSIFTPLPIMLLFHLWGLRGGGLAVLIGTLIISTFWVPLLGVVFFAEFGLLGLLLYHYVVRRRLTWDYGILLSSFIVLGILALLLATYQALTAFDIVAWIEEEIQQTGRLLFLSGSAENVPKQVLEIDTERITRFVLRILPALIILTVWLEGLVNVALLARITCRYAVDDRRITLRPDFSTWTCPDRLVWLGILGGALILTRIPVFVTVGINVVILLVSIYFLQGIAIVSFWFKKRNVPIGLRVMGYALIGVIQALPFLVAAMGLFDIWIDFRKVRPGVTRSQKKGD